MFIRPFEYVDGSLQQLQRVVLDVEVVELTECSRRIGSIQRWQPAGQREDDFVELLTATKETDSTASGTVDVLPYAAPYLRQREEEKGRGGAGRCRHILRAPSEAIASTCVASCWE